MNLIYKLKNNRKHIVISLIVLILISSLVFILLNAGSWLVVEDEPQPADAIVVLMGSPGDRMLQASEIYKKGYAENILIVNTHATGRDLLAERGIHLKTNAELSKEIGIKLGIPKKAVTILPGNAQSTRDEAAAIAVYLKNNKEINEVILITSSYHTRRSSAIFRKSLSKLDDHVTIITIPSDYTEFNARKWYTNRQSAKHVVMEYTRLFYFWLWERWRI